MSDDIDPLTAYYSTEYHRRNMQVARACGAQASIDLALERARSINSIPKWLISYLESAADRLPGLQHDLAAWRNLAPDSPYRRADLPATDAQAMAHPKVKALVMALTTIDALDPEGFIDGCSPSALRGLVLRMGETARAALAALEGKS